MRTPNFEEEHELEQTFGEERIQRFVTPYYLKLMSFHGATAGKRLSQEVRRRSRELTLADVDCLLRMSWRPRVMGAWFAIAVKDASLSDAVHDSLETCLGHLTAPPLILGTVKYPSRRTVDLLLDYARTDAQQDWGAAGFAAAAAARVAPEIARSSNHPLIQPEDLRQLTAMLDFADSLRTK